MNGDLIQSVLGGRERYEALRQDMLADYVNGISEWDDLVMWADELKAIVSYVC